MSVRINNYHGVLEVNTKNNSPDGRSDCPPPANKKDFPPAKCSIFATSASAVVPAPISLTSPTAAESSANPADDTININLGTVANDASYTVGFSNTGAILPGGTCNTVTGVITWEWSVCRSD
jgi:hypothetical protein